jgi:stage V sporulation protein D (sporulation-specific penicillin-binding protein)
VSSVFSGVKNIFVKRSFKKKIFFLFLLFEITIIFLCLRILLIQILEAKFWQSKAYEQQTRDRLIPPGRGLILDRNLNSLAINQTAASISVIHTQIKDPEKTAIILSKKLDLDYELVLKKINKKVALERIKIKVDKNIADEIRKLNLNGVVIDEDIKRIYPYDNLASHVLGFVGKDNQGIIGLEAKYDKYLKGIPGKIMTETDASGKELKNGDEYRKEPISGKNLVLSLDLSLQKYAEQVLEKAVKAKNAKRGAIIMMNPCNGEIYAMANKPDFNLNDPFEINDNNLNSKEKNDKLNKIWRNFNINDTYEPGSSFKIITSAAGLEENKVSLESRFTCSGSKLVGGRHIKCWRSPRCHGSQSFVEGVQNSCNPVFMEIAERLGAQTFYKYMFKFGLDKKTGVDLPGEAVGIMHKLKNVGPVELATMSFGQSFQITSLQLMRAASCVINGGNLITPHFAIKLTCEKNNKQNNLSSKEVFKDEKILKYNKIKNIISQKTCVAMRYILESVVSHGTGNKTYIPGYRIGGKTATSEKLPRRSGKYIASFLSFAPAENPEVMTLVLIDEPEGIYYGGTVAGPIMKEFLEVALPHLNIKQKFNDKELNLPEAQVFIVQEYRGFETNIIKHELNKAEINFEIIGNGKIIKKQFPVPGEKINLDSKIILYTE